MISHTISSVTGNVTLVGAGPGDPELITLRGLRALQQSDVVVHDRLISNELLRETKENALLINVGKRPKHHRVPQHQIERILILHAKSGKNVVRLKGGDPFIFGRGYEELLACQKEGIHCEVVPGITSAIAAPSAVGIPVTLRGVARSFAIITAESGNQFADPKHDWKALAKFDTISILMGRRTLEKSAKALVAAGRDPETPVACIERASLSTQRIIRGTLATIAQKARERTLSAPMVTVIGKVAALEAFADSLSSDPAHVALASLEAQTSNINY